MHRQEYSGLLPVFGHLPLLTLSDTLREVWQDMGPIQQLLQLDFS